MPVKTGRWAGKIHEAVYAEQVKWAIDAAEPYISYLTQSGDAAAAADIKAGCTPPDGLEVLQAIARSCKVHLVLLDQKSDCMQVVWRIATSCSAFGPQ